jgi:hypothetical protein
MSDVFMPRLLKGKAVYWASTGIDDAGNETYDDPIEVKCRWEEKTAIYIDKGGTNKTSRAIV